MAERIPPGRAGRLWLHSRLRATRRSAELLDRKRQLMRRELDHLQTARDATERAWRDACSEAEVWGRRSMALSGASDVDLAAASVAGRAQVQLPWRNTMGVVHPDEPRFQPALLGATAAAAAGAAVGPAAGAYRRALEAAGAYAAARTSFETVHAELLATERRLRAIERHRVPFLEAALANLELQLDELEREERIVARWARVRREQEQVIPIGGEHR